MRSAEFHLVLPETFVASQWRPLAGQAGRSRVPCLYAAGNEFYKGSIREGSEDGPKAGAGFPNVHFMENDFVRGSARHLHGVRNRTVTTSYCALLSRIQKGFRFKTRIRLLSCLRQRPTFARTHSLMRWNRAKRRPLRLRSAYRPAWRGSHWSSGPRRIETLGARSDDHRRLGPTWCEGVHPNSMPGVLHRRYPRQPMDAMF